MARGVGLSSDSASYMDCSINLSRGDGYNSALYRYFRPVSAEDYVREIVSGGRVKARPETYFPPLYSYVLAFLIKTGLSAETAATWMALVLFSLNVLLVGFLVFRFTRGCWPFAFAGALFMLGSESMLQVHTNVLSEPLFILLCTAGLAILSGYLEKGGRGLLLAGALVSGLAFLTRYSGAALIGTGLLGLCLCRRKPVLRRLPAALAFLFVSCLPMAGFILRNLLLTGRPPFPRPGFPVLGVSILREFRSVLASWALPGSDRVELFSVQNTILSSALAIVLVAVLIGTLVLARRDRKAGLSGGSKPGIPCLFALFAPVYLIVFLFAETFARGLLKADLRLLSPLFAPLLIISASILWRRLGPPPRGGIRRAVSAVLAVYALCYAGCGVYWMSVCHRIGRGYNSRIYQAPEVVQALDKVRALGVVPIFTNDCGAVYFQAGRYAYLLPSDSGSNDLAVIAEAVGSAPACFVCYWTPLHRVAGKDDLDRDRFEKSLIEIFGSRILVRTAMMTVLWRPALTRSPRPSPAFQHSLAGRGS